MICLPSIPDRRDPSEKQDTDGTPGPASEIFADITAWLVPSIVAGLPGILIAACLRFDYHVSRIKRPFDTPVPLRVAFKSRVADSDAKLKDVIGETGVYVPTVSELPSFPLVYFPATLALWAVTYLSVLYAGVFFAPSSTSLFADNSKYAGWAAIVGWPLMYAGLAGLAYYRGEWELFWSYEESGTIQRDTGREVGESGEGDALLGRMA